MILVTGATGLVGGNLLWYLLQQNERVTAIHRPMSSFEPLRTIFRFYTTNPDEYLARIDWKIANVLDINSLEEAIQGISIVYHCAAMVSFGNNSDTLVNTNVIGTRNMVAVAIRNNVRKFCFVSSIAACGKSSDNKLIDENTFWQENPDSSIYSRSKFYSEQEVWEGIKNGLNAVIVNPGVILGVSGNESGSSQLFSQVRKGLIFYTNGGSGYVGVQDVAKAMIQLTNSEISGKRFILVAENYSNKEILSWMADGFGKYRPFIPIGKRLFWFVGIILEISGKLFHFNSMIDRNTSKIATKRKYYSNKRIKNEIGFEFTPIEKCIKEVCGFKNLKECEAPLRVCGLKGFEGLRV